MDINDSSARLKSIKSMHYSASGEMLGLVLEKADGSIAPLAIREADLQRIIEMLLSLAKESARAPKAKARALKGWVGQPLDVDSVSLLNLGTETEAVLGLSFGRVTLAIKAPRLLWEQFMSDASVGKKSGRRSKRLN